MLNYEEEDYEDEFEDEFDDDEDVIKEIDVEFPTPHIGQLQVINSKAKWRILNCGRRWGKSFCCMQLSLEKLFNGESVAYITPTYFLGEEFFRDIQNYIPDEQINEKNKSSLLIRLKNGGLIKFFSGEATLNIRGHKFNRIVVDEAAFIPDLENIWTQVIMPTLATTNGDALFVSTPNGLHHFHALFLRGLDGEPNYESFHFPSSSSPFVSKEFLAIAKENMSEEKFAQEYLATPLASVGNPFGIEHIRKNIIQTLSIEPTIVYGIDLASHVDYTVIIGVDINNNQTYFDRFKLDWEATFNRIQLLPKDILKVVDASGVGDVMFSRLQSTCENVRGFKFTSTSKPAIINSLINEIQKGTIKYNEEIAKELSAFEQNKTATGYVKYEASRGFHDDCVAALAIANHHRHEAWATKNWKLYTI